MGVTYSLVFWIGLLLFNLVFLFMITLLVHFCCVFWFVLVVLVLRCLRFWIIRWRGLVSYYDAWLLWCLFGLLWRWVCCCYWLVFRFSCLRKVCGCITSLVVALNLWVCGWWLLQLQGIVWSGIVLIALPRGCLFGYLTFSFSGGLLDLCGWFEFCLFY